MYWECHQSERSETCPDHVLNHLGRGVDMTLKKALSDFPPARKGDIKAIDDCAFIRRFYDTWDQLLSIYFNSDLTHHTGVLIAISGITSLITKRTGFCLLSGASVDLLRLKSLWSVRDYEMNMPSPFYPTRSWASVRGARVELLAARRALLHRYLLQAKVAAADPLPKPSAEGTPEERAAQLGLLRINALLLPMVLVSDSLPEGERPGHYLTTNWLEGARFTCEATDIQVDMIFPNNLKVCCLPIICIDCNLGASGPDAVPFWENAGLILKQTGANTYEYQRVGFWEKSTTECDEADLGISDADHETFTIV